MSTIIPSLPSFQAGPAMPSGQTLVAAGGPIPPRIASLAAGAIIQAAVLPQQGAARGVLQVLTDAGPITLRARADLALPNGATLDLQAMGGGGQPTFRLVAVNGQAVSGLAIGQLAAGMPQTPGVPSPAGGLPPQAQAQASTPPIDILATSGGGAEPLSAPAPGLVATIVKAPAGEAVPLPSEGLPDLPVGAQLGVRIAQATPPGSAPPQPPAPSAAPPDLSGSPSPPHADPGGGSVQVTGTVLNNTAGGQAIVQTALGTLALRVPPDLPAGTSLTLEIVHTPHPITQPPPLPGAAAPGRDGWPALGEAVRTLAQAETGAGLSGMLENLPQPDARLAANLSLFASALKSGDANAILGQGMSQGLERLGRRDLAERLKKDFAGLSADSAKPMGDGDWSGFTLPLLIGVAVEPVRLYVRRQPKEAEDEPGGRGKSGGHRFLVDITLSRLGRVQLDGLVQRPAKRFDLIIRTRQPLSPEMRRDIGGLFADIGGASGTRGDVCFQAGGNFTEISPSPEGGTLLTV